MIVSFFLLKWLLQKKIKKQKQTKTALAETTRVWDH